MSFWDKNKVPPSIIAVADQAQSEAASELDYLIDQYLIMMEHPDSKDSDITIGAIDLLHGLEAADGPMRFSYAYVLSTAIKRLALQKVEKKDG